MRNDATLEGVRPRRGLWVVHPGRGRVYGQIDHVRADGTVVWRGTWGQLVPTDPGQLIDGGYRYSTTRPR